MATKTPKRTRELRTVPITQIRTGLNVRASAEPDPDLIASVKANGILQPPTVTQASDGYEIVYGHRRTNAAALAGLTEIEVIVVDGDHAEELRLVEQIVENEQRLSLTDAERVHGYRQLELFAVSPADIAKRLGVKRAKVDTALAVAKNEHTAQAIAEHGIGLDDAARILATTEDAGEIAALSQVASTNPDRLAHELKALERKRAYDARAYELTAELTATRVRLLETTTQTWADPTDAPGAVSLSRLGKPSDPAAPADPADIPNGALAARVVSSHQEVEGYGYTMWPTVQYFVIDPDTHGIPRRSHTREVTLSPEEQAERDAAQRAAAERRAAADAATAVRTDFIASVLQRPTLPSRDELFAYWIARDYYFNPPIRDVLALLGLAQSDDTTTAKNLANHTKTAPQLALAALAVEGEATLYHLGNQLEYLDLEAAAMWLATLSAWGYGLAAIEQEVIDAHFAESAAPAATSATAAEGALA